MLASTVAITRLGGSLGARVEGVDLSRIDDAMRDTIHALLMEHMMLAFPAQHLDDAAQLHAALQFGEFYVHPLARAMNRFAPACARIVDDADHPPFQDQYHTDVSWDPAPPTFGMLRMIDRPEVGGDTIFTNMALAYDRLSDETKAMIEPLRAWHDIGSGAAFRSKSGAGVTDKAAELVPGAEHPVVATHPVTGRRHLYVNRGFTRHIAGVPASVSASLLATLFEHAERPNFQIRWNWSVGDVILWDERCTMHYAVADFYPQRREVARVNVTSSVF